MNGDELFRGRLNGKDQVPPGKRSAGFYFEGLYHHQPEDAPRLKTEIRTVQRRLLDELDDVEDKRDATVEGDDILQVLLRGNRPRAGRRQSSDQVIEDQLPHFVRELNDSPPCFSKREETTDTERQAEDRDGSYEETTPLSWPLVAHWVGTLLIGISIVLTWPIVLAYFRD